MVNKNLYENYHKSIRLQKKIITLDNFTYRNILKNINKYIPKLGRVLDIGSATGTLSFFLASKGLKVDGIELSKNAYKYSNLNKSNLLVDNVNFYNISIEKYKTYKCYDLIICFEVLEHLKNDYEVLIKIKNLMKINSILALSVPSLNAPLYKLGFLKSFDTRVGHLRRYDVTLLKKLIASTGLKIIEISKSEGIFRNAMYTNKFLGYLLKLTKFRIVSNIYTYIDNLSKNIFGESQIILICKKI